MGMTNIEKILASHSGKEKVHPGYINTLKLEDGDLLKLNFETGIIQNVSKGTSLASTPFSEVQMEIYQNNGLF